MIWLAINGLIYKRHFLRPISGAEAIVALKHFGRHIPGLLLIVWDHSKPHRAKIVQDYLAAHPEIHVEWFPSYAPELNPEEFCHGNVKEQMRNATPDTVAEIRQQANRGFARLRKRPDLLLNYFHLAGLKLKQLWE